MPPHQTRPLSATRCRSSTPSFTKNASSALSSHYAPTNVEADCGFHPVYIKLTTAANFPHAKRLELAQPDYAWKLTLAATILAGFGFVAFRMINKDNWKRNCNRNNIRGIIEDKRRVWGSFVQLKLQRCCMYKPRCAIGGVSLCRCLIGQKTIVIKNTRSCSIQNEKIR
ncbi:unnamed protein product [Rodentolepis nana]|uniref:Complex I-ESSS n=1 Tax=Rodentolepis nana TaxID=102285 RepID=A0A0R3TDJ5_RODNA|nr:unnamed protein product [Rodentolepis nana]